MPSVNEIRRHVYDDAWELAATTRMLVPLIDAELSADDEAHDALRFLRRILAHHVALIVIRLHEPRRDKGPTGTTASIPALLEYAREEGRLFPPELYDGFTERLETVKANFTSRGGNWDDLRDFRHSELAHSLHRHSQPPARILFRPLWELAHETFELVGGLERYLDQTGMDSMFLENRFELWRNRGLAFWTSHAAFPKGAGS